MKKHLHTSLLLKYYVVAILSIISITIKAQSTETQTVIIQEAVDTIKVDTMNCHASFPGGYDSLFYYINNTLKYPEDAVKRGKEGKVVFSYSIDEKGKIRNISIVDDSEIRSGDLVKKLFEGMPEWKPARVNGKKVEKRYTMVISFNLKYAPGGKLEPDKFTFWKV